MHARSLYVRILNQDGKIMRHRHMKASPEPFLKALEPYWAAMVVAVAYLLTWDLALHGDDEPRLSALEVHIVKVAQPHHANPLYLLQTVPGIAKILSLVLLYEIHDIPRCPSVQDVVSSDRVVKGANESAGIRDGTAGTKIGKASFKGAFSEAAVLLLRDHPAGQTYLTRLANTHA